MKRIYILFLTAIIIAASSCNKVDNITIDPIYNLISNVDPERASNPNNCYDYVGRLHFDGVKYVTSHQNWNTSIGNILVLSSQFYETSLQSKNGPSGPNVVNNIFTEEEIYEIYENARDKFIICNRKDISLALQQEFESFSRVIMDLCENSNEYSYEVIKNRMIQYENTVLENSSLSEDEQQVVLESTSIFRYSTLQWEEVVDSIEPDDTKVVISTEKLKWWQWLIVGAADAAGGAIASLIGPGGQTVLGAVTASTGAILIMVGDKSVSTIN